MKTFKKIMSLSLLATAVSSYQAIAFDNVEKKIEKTAMTRVGEIKDDSVEMSHTTRHRHNLEFIDKDTGKSYDVVDSPALEKIHCESGKNLLVEVEAELTPRVLFWGNNLIVKNFKILGETSDLIPHQEPRERVRADRI